MSEEYENSSSITSSNFIPLLILLVGLAIWIGYQDYQVNLQRQYTAAQLDQAQKLIPILQADANKYVTLMDDLLKASGKDKVAAQIVSDAVRAGLLRVDNSGAATTNGTTNPAAPSSTPSPTAPSTTPGVPR